MFSTTATKRFTTTYIAALALTVSIWATGCAPLNGSQNFEITQPVTHLKVEHADGNVSIVAADIQSIIVEADVYGANMEFSHSLEGDMLRLDATPPRRCPGCRVDLRVTVPANVTVDVGSGSGNVELEGLAASAELSSGSGKVVVRRFSGANLDLSTGNGKIEATDVDSLFITASSGSGNATVKCVTPPEDLVVRSGSGNANVEVPTGEYNVEWSAWDGMFTFDGIIMNQAAARRIKASSGSGNVTIQGR